jgi:hypothetical protein
MPKHRLRSLPQEATAKIRWSMSVGRSAWSSTGVLPKGLAAEIPEECSKLTSAYEPKYDRLRCGCRGPLRGVPSAAPVCHPRVGAVLLRTIWKSEQY